jgi:hypothetical protein
MLPPPLKSLLLQRPFLTQFCSEDDGQLGSRDLAQMHRDTSSSLNVDTLLRPAPLPGPDWQSSRLRAESILASDAKCSSKQRLPP